MLHQLSILRDSVLFRANSRLGAAQRFELLASRDSTWRLCQPWMFVAPFSAWARALASPAVPSSSGIWIAIWHLLSPASTVSSSELNFHTAARICPTPQAGRQRQAQPGLYGAFIGRHIGPFGWAPHRLPGRREQDSIWKVGICYNIHFMLRTVTTFVT